MVAATHRGAYGLINQRARDAALYWLESLDPPIILAARAERTREGLTNYVPNNVDWLLPRPEDRTAKSMAAHVPAGNQSVVYHWNFVDGADAVRHADAVSAMSSLITYLGRTVDHVYARGTVQRDSKNLHQDGSAVYRPRLQIGGRWLVPAPGFLELCKRRYPRSVSEEPPDFTNSRQVEYETETALREDVPIAVFAMWRSNGRMLAFDPRLCSTGWHVPPCDQVFCR